MTSVIQRPVKRFVPILQRCYTSKYCIDRSYSLKFIKKQINCVKDQPLILSHSRSVSSSSLTKSGINSTNDDGPKDEQTKNILDDAEFQSILSDFSKDFGVGSDSEPILDEIRKSLEEPECKQSESNDENFSSSPSEEPLNNVLKTKFKEFSDNDATFIPSSEELQSTNDVSEPVYHITQEMPIMDYPEELKRGIHGVFDVEELVDVLRKEKLINIVTISVPKELHYADFLMIATANSPRHCKAACERIKKLYKIKKHAKDPFVIVEGEKMSDWKALDMGNIVLHVFLGETRNLYDIESLWLFDSAFDKGGNLKDDPMYRAIEQQMSFFDSINESITQEPSLKK